MNEEQNIRLVTNQNIDYRKWDACIERSASPKLYARSWYLDRVTEGWCAFIRGDYDFVMPLPVTSRWGIKHISQPAYFQQAGIFPSPEPEIQKQFAQKLYRAFRFIRYQINIHNHPQAFDAFSIKEKTNYILPLNRDYKTIASGYARHTHRNLKASSKFHVSIVKGLPITEYLEAKQKVAGSSFSPSDYRVLKRLMVHGLNSGKGTLYAAYTRENILCAAAFFILDGQRIYYLNSFSDQQGRKNMAMYPILDTVIRANANTRQTLDFEGSVIPQIAWFFRGFGPLAEKYCYIYSNRLPVIRKFMK
jgi:hypothetical protein